MQDLRDDCVAAVYLLKAADFPEIPSWLVAATQTLDLPEEINV